MKTAPVATYRIQFRNGFGFGEALAALPYLKRLGISHVYASPLQAAVSGSTHGYDVIDPNAIDPVLGGRDGFDRLTDGLLAQGMGLILDIVPNHMAASLENPWWRSAVQLGVKSPHASFFDIDWTSKLTLPFLGQPFDDAVAAGEISVETDPATGEPALRYFETLWPLHPDSWHQARRLVGRTDDPQGLSSLHEAQVYRLGSWKEGRRDLSYRRFFEVTGLVGVRVEDPSIFEATHRLILELVCGGQVEGLRVDHVDGLADPTGYLRRLRAAVGPDCGIWVEKILGHGENLPADWPIDGTTGYEFIDAAADLLCEGNGLATLTRAQEDRDGSGATDPFQVKLRTVTWNFEGELERIVDLGTARCDLPREVLRDALAALAAGMPVYRTYWAGGAMTRRDRDILSAALARAQRHVLPGLLPALQFWFGFLGGTGAVVEGPAGLALARFQQLCGPVMAKSIEDTLFYRDTRLIALNEVGSGPDRPWPLASRFHRMMCLQATNGALTLNAGATHDTKRGEDARARLMTLADAPAPWLEALPRWQAGVPRQDRGFDHFLLQSLLGAADGCQHLVSRMEEFALKAAREAKLWTHWIEPDPAYEKQIEDRIAQITAPEFVEPFLHHCAGYIEAGWHNSMLFTIARLLAPGLPDIYQGTERGDFSLVDPDNRRAVDFRELASQFPQARPDGNDHPAWKHWLIATLLHERARRPALYTRGAYLPLSVTGSGNARLFAFARQLAGAATLCVLRLYPLACPDRPAAAAMLQLPGDLASRPWTDLLSGETFDKVGAPDVQLGDRVGMVLVSDPDPARD